jgi:Ca-activated chloride channel family protein
LSGIRVRAEGFDVYDVQPAHLPDLFAQRPVVLFGKWRGRLAGSFHVSGKTGYGDYESRLDVAEVQPDDANLALRYLWARSRIAELSDYGVGQAGPDDIAAITSLGLKYNLLTRYTSFIAVREVVRNAQGPAQDVNQPLPLPNGVSDLAVGTQSGSEPGLIWLIAIGLAVVLLTVCRNWRRLV